MILRSARVALREKRWEQLDSLHSVLFVAHILKIVCVLEVGRGMGVAAVWRMAVFAVKAAEKRQHLRLISGICWDRHMWWGTS